ncbi:hypothetical protein [Bacillus sp. FJAT-49736]|uniref:hypothetical protein n=1 Tax=Bacillus sp. FJAT-49736 TaxID=2833582 RepID=UPI001BC934D4|nr:hypothetical protein [Bacillus sp. FJAT-49736]MBS4174113.1 hypothetical protein [Bacillus sp. FJAT-49736]
MKDKKVSGFHDFVLHTGDERQNNGKVSQNVFHRGYERQKGKWIPSFCPSYGR